MSIMDSVRRKKAGVVRDVSAPVMEHKLKPPGPAPLPGQLDLFTSSPKTRAHQELVEEVGRVQSELLVGQIVIANCEMSHAQQQQLRSQMLRKVAAAAANVVGRILITNCESFACQDCVVKYDVDGDDRDPKEPWPIGPMRFRPVKAAADGVTRTCIWCGKGVKGAE